MVELKDLSQSTKEKGIFIKTLEVSGFVGAIIGMRCPMKSYNKLDSKLYSTTDPYMSFELGENDLKTATNLLKGGAEESKFRRMIHVQAFVRMPLYWWVEMDTYKVATVRDSESTMHRLLKSKKPISIEQFFLGGYADEETVKQIQECVYTLEKMRKAYMQEEENSYSVYSQVELISNAKKILNEAYIQGSVLDLNYETISNMYHQRKNHRLKVEWRDVFCLWVERLPYFKELIEPNGIKSLNERYKESLIKLDEMKKQNEELRKQVITLLESKLK